jgi:hypothetical protein
MELEALLKTGHEQISPISIRYLAPSNLVVELSNRLESP